MPTLSRTYQEAQDVYIQCSTLLPESSIEFLDSYLVTTEQKQLRQGSNYTAMMETIEKVIHENIQDPQPYMDILMGDICSDNIGSPITAAKYC